jgi:hypothetical protein
VGGLKLLRMFSLRYKRFRRTLRTYWMDKKIKRYKTTTLRVIETSIMDFFYRLNYILCLVTSYEFEEWIANRLKIEPNPEIENETENATDNDNLDPLNQDLSF